MVNDSNNIFMFNNFKDAKGGTELMVSQILKNVNNDLLSQFDIIVSYPPKDFIKGEKPSILWLHDLADDPYFNILSNVDFQNQFDIFVFVSHWQKNAFMKKYDLPPHKCLVIKNAIDIVEESDAKLDNLEKIKLVYTSTPQRGLNILYEVFKELKSIFPDRIELNVFSSFDLYGERHKVRNDPYNNLFEKLKADKDVNYYGSVDHDELIKNLKEQHIWCLPSIWQETSCISLMEAMSAKCICIHSDLAALPETSANFSVMYPFHENINDHALSFYDALSTTIQLLIENPENFKKHLAFQKLYFDIYYNWSVRAREWSILLQSQLSK